MNQGTVKDNYIYNLLLTISSYVASLIVYPYVSRILGVENMGILGFINKTIESFLLFSLLGVSVVGVREIAKSKDDRSRLNDAFSAIVSCVFFASLIVSVIYVILITTIPRFHENSCLFYAGLTRIVLSAFFLDWFYQGLENFKYIAVRTVCIRIAYILLVFLIVKERTDYQLYFYITLMTYVFDAGINFYQVRKIVEYKFQYKKVFAVATPMLTYGFYSVLNATFSTFNYVLLGFLCSNTQVGYYSTADQLYKIFLSLITAFTTVMLPRMSSLLNNGDRNQFNSALERSLDGILMVCVPLAIFGVFFASQIVLIVSGKGYEGAIVPLQVMMILVLINAVNQVFIIQAAIPLGLDKAITLGTAIAAFLSVPINYYMMKNFQAIGGAFVLVSSVVLANIYPLFVLFRKRYIRFPIEIFLSRITKSIPYFIIAIIGCISKKYINEVIVILSTSLMFGVCFLICNFNFIKGLTKKYR